MVIIVLSLASLLVLRRNAGCRSKPSDRSSRMKDTSKISAVLMLLLALAVAVLIIHRIAATLP